MLSVRKRDEVNQIRMCFLVFVFFRCRGYNGCRGCVLTVEGVMTVEGVLTVAWLGYESE